MKESFKELSLDELRSKVLELRKKYFDFRVQAVVGHIENPLQGRILRRKVARLETRIRGKEIELAGQKEAGHDR